jgi:ATP-dependent Clp protease adaptor protein ClpS
MAERGAGPGNGAGVEREVRRDLEWWVAEDTGGEGRVIIHNDDVTPYAFVVAVLRAAFRLAALEAERVTWEAHTRGQAHVVTLSWEEAKYRVGKAHGLARQAGYPLAFTIETV